jgi:L,D-transpeptidase ErfK/SrfK
MGVWNRKVTMRTRTELLVLLVMVGLVVSEVPGLGQEALARSLARLAPVFGASELYPREGKDDIYEVARRFGVSASALFNANRGDLLIGDELLLIPKRHIAPVPWAQGAVVNLAERNLYLYEEGRPATTFPVTIGMRGWETPTGEFEIANKAKNPTWFPPDWATEEEPVPPGPDNPLGDRWMGLSQKGYGIHATNAPWTVGRYLSHGCMRMYPEHAHELYELVRVGMPVVIVYRRVVFGFGPDEGVVYMAYYPDPYRFGEVRPEYVREALEEYGLEDAVDMRAVREALERPSGVPIAIVGSREKVLVNGKRVEFALGPTRVGGDWLVPAGPVVAALGASVELGPRTNYVVVSRGNQRLFFSPGDRDAIVNGRMVRLEAAPQLLGGYPLIPLKATVTLLGGSVGWDEAAGEILVWDGWRRSGISGLEPR